MKKTIPLFFVLAIAAATIATYSRYESFSPCIWIEQDQARATGLPTLVTRGRLHAEFLLRGIREPDAMDCLLSWWDFRLEGATRG
jgi:hypothetical protein